MDQRMSREGADAASPPPEAASHRPRRRVRWPVFALGVLAWAALAAYTVITARPQVESDLSARAAQTLESSGETWATAAFDGRDATLRGESLAEEARAKVRAALEGTFGVRTVRDETTLLPERRPFTFSAIKDGRAVSLDGYVPSEDARARIATAAKVQDTVVSGQDRLVRARGAPPGDFAALVAFGLDLLGRLPSGRLTLSDGALAIEGRAGDLETYEALRKALQGPLPQGLTLARFAVRPPVAAPFFWSANRENGSVRVTGFIPSEEARREVATALADALPGVRLFDETRLADGAPSADLWLKAVRFGAAQLAQLPAGRLTLSDTAIALEGAAPTFPVYDALAAARRAPPEGFQVTRFAVEPPRAIPFTWSIERTADGVRMIGFVPSEEARRVLIDAVRTAFPGVSPQDELRLATGGPPPDVWSAGASFAVAQLARLRTGLAAGTGTRIELSGEARDAASFNTMREAAKTTPGGIAVSVEKVTPPLISPYVFSVRRDETGLTISGFYPSEAAHQSILGTIDRYFLKEKVNDVSALGGGAPAGYLEGVTAGLRQLSRLAVGDLTLGDGQLRLAGTTLQPGAAAAIEGALRSGAGQGMTPDVRLELAAPGAPVAPAECQRLLGDLLARATIHFDFGSARIDPRSFGLLDRLAYDAQRCPAARVEIVGHTDSIGDDGANQALSVARAEAVVAYLAGAGIARERLSTVGYGATRPIAPNDTDANRARNRRIEFVVK